MDTTYIVVPFLRNGQTLGARQIIVCDNLAKAEFIADHLSNQFPGVAVIERRLDEDSGADHECVVSRLGAVPPRFPDIRDWQIRLN